jgi:hypothetical protein
MISSPIPPITIIVQLGSHSLVSAFFFSQKFSHLPLGHVFVSVFGDAQPAESVHVPVPQLAVEFVHTQFQTDVHTVQVASVSHLAVLVHPVPEVTVLVDSR